DVHLDERRRCLLHRWIKLGYSFVILIGVAPPHNARLRPPRWKAFDVLRPRLPQPEGARRRLTRERHRPHRRGSEHRRDSQQPASSRQHPPRGARRRGKYSPPGVDTRAFVCRCL
ncbi:unnamed protein product, partial [Ectocarpus sp. 12 AP-2014]